MRLHHAAVIMSLGLATLAVSAYGQGSAEKFPADDLATNFKAPVVERDYDKRVVMIPMRDGTKLYTVIVVPKGAKSAPIVLTRTCYNAAGRAARSESPRMIEALPLSDEGFVESGYIRVYQDVRGKYGSEGVYLMTPPPVNSGFNPSGADDTTDAYDTIDWLIKNVPESNGRVGMIGSSYEGFTVVMALLHPHPALKVAAPESPMVDGWMGDDWFHYGAFRENNLDYFVGQTTMRGAGVKVTRAHRDDYTNFLEAGSAGDFARSLGEDQLPYWRTVEQHPAYDGFWQSQALDKLIAQVPTTVPTMWEQGLWDQEDMWGAIHSFRALEPKDKDHLNHLVMGPWRHSQVNREGRTLGPMTWATDTTAQWRRDVLLPFFNQYLKPGSPKADTPHAWIYNTGEDHWETPKAWPASCEKGCPTASKRLYLTASGKLSFDAPASAAPNASSNKFDEYISDPAKPVPYRPRPVAADDNAAWGSWLVTDQRFVEGRPDVLTYESEPLKEPMKLSGEPVAHLFASTSGTDSDWVVKIIDVFPDRGTPPVDMNGYELPLSTDIFRGRYRTSFEKPAALTPDEPLPFTFGLPMINHTIQPGHRLMVQIQSTLFPLYDRNPQRFVPNIFDAKPADYQKATQRIWHSGETASYISLPVVPITE
ncbi:CocE/NonD family hydrolase [Granulicella sibirica]|uniref:Glutaryl-7-ACA acylase n=1 Tax=Granulicella sibirica TaxID=2479048 RepID=A0A4Q0SYH6_9BACT|nr:CocE/NonD family hydrolase [Granulicella sibirica]RXH54678.1 Glutaryl-7-ACA acylase [Granulicella sibirica]